MSLRPWVSLRFVVELTRNQVSAQFKLSVKTSKLNNLSVVVSKGQTRNELWFTNSGSSFFNHVCLSAT